ncbi:hypothetical protein LOC71_12865 [Rhodopirellula sp. JC740]|uniref:Uncharacterized protein n=1 Tax=Rhodopirellula halodulae TaxID=2894198 RepID=A0ABS8NHY4_9BACT|nr:hypothetical protein [Rhodopirellula sp. JC740]MCC9643169.1 hypothetical protein [Rhodopirellula sp. JC740]
MDSILLRSVFESMTVEELAETASLIEQVGQARADANTITGSKSCIQTGEEEQAIDFTDDGSHDRLQVEIERLTELDCWQNIDFETEWANVPEGNQRLMLDRHINERIVRIENDLMRVRFMPAMDDELTEFIPGSVTIWLEPISWLAPNHRETIQETIDEVLQAYGHGYWECEDWDELYEFGIDGVTVTLAGYESE